MNGTFGKLFAGYHMDNQDVGQRTEKSIDRFYLSVPIIVTISATEIVAVAEAVAVAVAVGSCNCSHNHSRSCSIAIPDAVVAVRTSTKELLATCLREPWPLLAELQSDRSSPNSSVVT